MAAPIEHFKFAKEPVSFSFLIIRVTLAKLASKSSFLTTLVFRLDEDFACEKSSIRVRVKKLKSKQAVLV